MYGVIWGLKGSKDNYKKHKNSYYLSILF